MAAQRKAAAGSEARDSGAINSISREEFTALVRESATGHWAEILAALGIEATALRNRHGPCPGCGGADRYRFDDRDGRGTFICTQGMGDTLSGDGLDLLRHVFGWSFGVAVEEVARVLGLQRGRCKKADAVHIAKLKEQARQRQAKADAERLAKHRRCAEEAAALWGQGSP